MNSLSFFRTDELKIGEFKGEDKFGNKYYESGYYFFGEKILTASHLFVFTSSLQMYPVSILRKSISGRHRPVRVADGPMTARCRFT